MKRRRRSDNHLAHQLDRALRENARLRARIRALEATSRDSGLLTDIAETLTAAAHAAHPHQATPTDRDSTRRSRGDTPIPGAGTAAARRAQQRLWRDLASAVGRWHHAAAKGFAPPPRPPAVTCPDDSCPNHRRRLPAWRSHPDGTRTTTDHCPACGTPTVKS